jgi:hypothetical protein
MKIWGGVSVSQLKKCRGSIFRHYSRILTTANRRWAAVDMNCNDEMKRGEAKKGRVPTCESEGFARPSASICFARVARGLIRDENHRVSARKAAPA